MRKKLEIIGAITFNSPMAMKNDEMKKVKK
jgi:hypothetical protein